MNCPDAGPKQEFFVFLLVIFEFRESTLWTKAGDSRQIYFMFLVTGLSQTGKKQKRATPGLKPHVSWRYKYLTEFPACGSSPADEFMYDAPALAVILSKIDGIHGCGQLTKWPLASLHVQRTRALTLNNTDADCNCLSVHLLKIAYILRHLILLPQKAWRIGT